MKNKLIIASIIGIALLSSIFTTIFYTHSTTAQLGGATYNTAPVFAKASTTAFTLTTTAQQLLATTTTPRRYAATIQAVNCSVGSSAVFIDPGALLGRSVTANTGLAVYGSTTMELKDYPNLPVVQNSVSGITAIGTCTVLVTEYRTLY